MSSNPDGHSHLQAVTLQYLATVPHIGGVVVSGLHSVAGVSTTVPAGHSHWQVVSLQTYETVPHICAMTEPSGLHPVAGVSTTA